MGSVMLLVMGSVMGTVNFSHHSDKMSQVSVASRMLVFTKTYIVPYFWLFDNNSAFLTMLSTLYPLPPISALQYSRLFWGRLQNLIKELKN